jgi:hypothetical protein
MDFHQRLYAIGTQEPNIVGVQTDEGIVSTVSIFIPLFCLAQRKRIGQNVPSRFKTSYQASLYDSPTSLKSSVEVGEDMSSGGQESETANAYYEGHYTKWLWVIVPRIVARPFRLGLSVEPGRDDNMLAKLGMNVVM